MSITVGKDTAKTRKILKSGDLSVAYYSIDAAESAGLGDFKNLPAVLKVVLENMLRFEDGKTGLHSNRFRFEEEYQDL